MKLDFDTPLEPIVNEPARDLRPTAPQKAVVLAELAKVRDLDLPARERPSRRGDDVQAYPSGTAVEFGERKVEVIGPGRGLGWIYVAWFDGVPCLGQVHVDQIGGE